MPILSRLLAGAGLAALAVAPAYAHETFRFHADHVLGTSLDMVIDAPRAEDARFAFAAAGAEIARLDRVLSGWRADSELAAVNRGEAARSDDLRAVLAACEAWRTRTDGAFDARRGECFDIDGLAKGYVIDAAMAAARRAAPCASGMLIDLGGDVRCWGERAFTVGVADLSAMEENAVPVATLRLKDGALAVSGPGMRGPHLIDPATGQASWRQAAVVGRTTAEADALSTALAVMQPDAAIALAERLPGFEAMVFAENGTRSQTSGWAAMTCRASGPLPANFKVTVQYELPKIAVSNYEKPYVVIWVTDADKQFVKTLSILGARQDWQENNYVWWRRYGRKQPGVLETTAKPTRTAGRYSIGWDGTDQAGKRVAQGRYIVHIEVSREHGGHTYQTVEVDLGAGPVSGQIAGEGEVGPVAVRYGKSQ